MEFDEVEMQLNELGYKNSDVIDKNLYIRTYYDQTVVIDIINKIYYVVGGLIRSQEQLDNIQIALNNVKRDFGIIVGGGIDKL